MRMGQGRKCMQHTTVILKSFEFHQVDVPDGHDSRTVVKHLTILH